MLTVTDITAIIFLIILAANGAYQGFLRALISPVALILSTLTTVFVYLGTKNFSASFLTAIVGSFFYGWILVWGLKKWLNADEAPRLSIISRVGGQVVNLVWGGFVAFLVIAFLAFFPFDRFDLGGVSKDVRSSVSFQWIKPIFIGKVGVREPPVDLSTCQADLCSADHQDLENLATDPQVQEVMNDPRVQGLINDPEIQKAVENKDYRLILTSPVLRELSADPQFLLKVLKAYPRIQKTLPPSNQNN